MQAALPNRERILSIDALRGFALFGILVVNIFVFHAPYPYYGQYYGPFTGVEATALHNMIFFFGGKFMFIFAFLFGYGCWLQYQKYESRAAFRNFWLRRMVLLAVFGILHILLLSFGDILLPYALLGMLLPFVIHWKTRWLIVLATILYLVPVAEFVVRQWLDYGSIFMQSDYTLEEHIQANKADHFWERLQIRLHNFWSFRNEKLVMYIPKELGLFLAGIIAGRKQMAQKLNRRKALGFSILAAFIVATWYTYGDQIRELFNYQESTFQAIVLGLIIQLEELMQGFLYITAFWLLWESEAVRKILIGLRYVGKMSLTNYILQSLICAILFITPGFALYASLAPTQLLGLAVGIFVVQCIASWLWLRYYSFGPLEWVWRKWSYVSPIS